MSVPLPPAAAMQHAVSLVRTISASDKAPPLSVASNRASTRASTMLIFGDPADEGTGFGVGWEASADDGQQQLPARAEEGGLAGQMRSTIKQRAMRLEDLKLARQNAGYDERGHATEEAPHWPADEGRNVMTDLHEITPLVELERERMKKEEDMKRAARAALKWKKEASRRAAERASGKDTNRTPPSRFEDVVLLLLQDSRKKALDKIKRRGDGAAKRRAKDDGAATESGQRVGVSSLIHGALHASIDTDERRRLSADGGRSAPECGGSDRKNKKRARGRSQSSFRNQQVERESPTTKQAHSFPQRQPRKSVAQAPRKGSSAPGAHSKKSYHRGRAERGDSNAVRRDGLDSCNYINGFACGTFDPAGSMVNLSVESSVHVTVSDGESSNVHCRDFRNGFQAGGSRPLGGRISAVKSYAGDGEHGAGGENGGGVGDCTYASIPSQSQPRSGRKEPGLGGDGGSRRRRNQLGEPGGSGGIYRPSGNCVNPVSEDDRECRNSGDRRKPGPAEAKIVNQSGARHARRRWLNRARARSGDGAVAATPVEYAGGQCTVVALDLDRKALHVRQLPENRGRGTHKIVSLSQVSASLGRRRPGLVVLRWSGRHLATIGQGAWRDVCARQAAHKKHVKSSGSAGAEATTSSDALKWDSCELSRRGTRRSRRRRRRYCHDDTDFEATFAADVSRMRSNGSRGLYRSLVPSLPRRFFGQESITTPVTAGTNSGLGSCGAGYNHSESLEPSPQQWCSIHGAGGFIQVEGTGCLSTGEPSVGVLTVEGSCSLESGGGNLPRPTPPPRAAPSSSKASRATARPERRISESVRACTCPSRPSVPVVASGDGGEGAGVSLPTAPPLRRDEREAAAPSRYRGKPTFVTAIPSLADQAYAENAETPPPCVVSAADCSAVEPPRQEQRRQQVVCCGRGGEIGDGHRLDGAATNNNSCNRHQASVDSSVDNTAREPKRSSSPPPSAAAATAGAATPTATPSNTTEAAPKPWTLVNKMFTNSNTARLRGRTPHGTAQQQARTLPRTAPPGLRKGGGGGGSRSSYISKTKKDHRASSQPPTVGAGPTAPDTDRFSRRWDKRSVEKSVEHVSQGRQRGAAESSDACMIWQELGRLKVTQGVAGLTFSRSGCFDPDDGSLVPEGSDGGTTDGLSPRLGGGTSESPNSSSSIWSESSCHSMSESTWSGASFDEERDQEKLSVHCHGDVDHRQGDADSDLSSSSSNSSSKHNNNSGFGAVQQKSAQRVSSRSAIPCVGRGGGLANDARRRTHAPKDTEGASLEGTSLSASVVLAGLQHQAQKELGDFFVQAAPAMVVRIAADVPSAIQTVQIMPPSIVVVAWTAFGSAKAAREFLGGGARGMRGVKPGLPVVVVGGENDGEGLRISLEAMGASAVLLWPYNSGDTKEVLQKYLQMGR